MLCYKNTVTASDFCRGSILKFENCLFVNKVEQIGFETLWDTVLNQSTHTDKIVDPFCGYR